MPESANLPDVPPNSIDPGRPDPGEYLDYFETYISLVGNGNIVDLLELQVPEMRAVFDPLTMPLANAIHAPYTWSIKQVLGHCLDNERVFGYRASRFAAGDSTSLPGYDQDAYVAQTDYRGVSLKGLMDEFEWVRRANIGLLRRQSGETWRRSGLADGKPISVRAIAYLLSGHVEHHLRIVKQRLLDA